MLLGMIIIIIIGIVKIGSFGKVFDIVRSGCRFDFE